MGYLRAAHEATLAYLRGVTDADLDEVIDTSWDPPVTRGVRLVSIADDDAQHVGQAAYLRGLLDQPWRVVSLSARRSARPDSRPRSAGEGQARVARASTSGSPAASTSAPYAGWSRSKRQPSASGPASTMSKPISSVERGDGRLGGLVVAGQ